MSRFALLQGLICNADPRGVAQSPLQSTSATSVFCAKAERQQQVFSVRKRSDSNKCLIYENIVAVTADVQSTLFCLD
ncbi:hypothetical protein ABE61_03550 [Lysinibacillus sphaericus]|nr:hypothetical protein [Lysinibacillus sphaericus]MBG9477881.1 hypothetical protein [Lysinibacillus sphaericus]MBG9592211.1 hypothetical protein [Lysinibacillus sphaericus]